MSWISLIPSLLSIAAQLLSWAKARQDIAAGRDEEIARAAMKVLELTAYGKRLNEKLLAMGDDEARALYERLVVR